MSTAETKLVTFIQYDVPPLKAGEYTVTVQHNVNQASQNQFAFTRRFAVAGERFAIDPSEISGVYPADVATGEFAGVLPQVLFTRRTLPWERTSVQTEESAPWLAVLLFDDGDEPAQQKVTAKDLIAAGTAITVAGSTLTGSGQLPAGTFSYPGINPLDYGETPDDACTVIDVPLALFNQIAPSAADLPYLAHIREVDTTDSEDSTTTSAQLAIVLGNRLPKTGVTSHAYLVSLENLGPYLPHADGTPSGQIPTGTTAVRLLVYRYWRYTANAMDGTFKNLLENVNRNPDGTLGLTSLQFPFAGTAPAQADVELAMNHQANGQLTATDAQVLVHNAFTMGYVPLGHHLRHAGNTVSWYRGPLVAYPVSTTLTIPISGPDAANRYNPQTGLFDVSYGAAWQLGLLLALQNRSYATALYNWKRTVQQSEAIAEEQALLDQQLGGVTVLESFLKPRRLKADAGPPQPPDDVVNWLAKLKLLGGVPVNYLVPDERMLPPESLRFFYLDFNWIDAMMDGAFSIGRASTGEQESDAMLIGPVKQLARQRTRLLRKNQKPMLNYTNETGQVTGFLLRSQAVAGWPRLNANGYADLNGTVEIPKLRMARLSDEVVICLFDGVVQMVAIHEPPEQLHSGAEGSDGTYTTTLRAITGDTPGQQFLTDPKGGSPDAAISVRSDKQTLMVQATADAIMTKLNNDFSQNVTTFTSAEFALEMVKGVVKVEFQQGG
ncbi:MAG: hypothetical protein K0R39_1666 [Symbiobacteriaceae bacterium]|jgi:hypothetical protein|nr:hypothetical protein [Symbiobacteriaceae bacterium]